MVSRPSNALFLQCVVLHARPIWAASTRVSSIPYAHDPGLKFPAANLYNRVNDPFATTLPLGARVLLDGLDANGTLDGLLSGPDWSRPVIWAIWATTGQKVCQVVGGCFKFFLTRKSADQRTRTRH